MITHLACIMDGNRRWARQRGWLPWYGHKEGAESIKTVIEFCIEKQIQYVSLYTFSAENLQRPADEKKYLFDFLVMQIKNNVTELIAKGVQVRFIGDRSLFPETVLPTCELIEEQTKELTTLQLNFLFCYGSQQELLHGIKAITQQVAQGDLSPDAITHQTIKQSLWLGDIPEPEVIIRTGGFKRLSNFLLYQAAYSELYFLDCLWPELRKQDLQNVFDNFVDCRRNFGT